MKTDLVLCELENGKDYLFYAPFCSSLDAGDSVIVETIYGEKAATVSAIYRTCSEDVAQFAIACAGGRTPLKRVLAKIITREIKYEEGDGYDGKE